MKNKDLNIICKKYGCYIDSFEYIYIFKDEKWLKIGKIYFKSKNNFYYPQTLQEKNIGGEKDFESCLVRLLQHIGYIVQ